MANSVIWSEKEAEDWESEAYPIGNGRLGAMVFGEVEQEHIQFNEETLFSGKPMAIDEKAYLQLDKVRELLKHRQYKEADEYTNNVFLKKGAYGIQSEFGMYQNMGEVLIEHCNQNGMITGYKRQLDLDEAVVKINYQCDDIKYCREYLSSYPANVIAFRMTCSDKKALNLKISMISKQDNGKVTSFHDEIKLTGTTGYLEYEARLKVVCENGIVHTENDKLCIEQADGVTVLLTAATEYCMDNAGYRGNDYKQHNQNVLKNAVFEGWNTIKEKHIKDYRNLFCRVDLQLEKSENAERTTKDRLSLYREGACDHDLEALLFHYGRYLLISSSRQGTLPANLQGIWNNSNNPIWGSMFCYNINLNMNYWPAEVTNLQECHVSLLRFIDSLRISGRKTAKAYFKAGGWFAGKKSDIWGFTQPYADAVFGLFIGGAGWLCQDIWEYYSFNKDLNYLEKTAYPIMKECAEFYLDYLIENEDAVLVSSPSSSPEQVFYVDGRKVAVSDGCEIDHRIIEELFDNCINCCEILKIDEDFKCRLKESKKRIALTKIGKNGEIQEWYHDWDYPEKTHRHLSNMYVFFPGQKYMGEKNPDLVNAAIKTMNTRGDEETGWSRAWKINLWARLSDGNRAYKVLQSMVKTHINNNLLATHPPFQIDGNLGYTSGVAEMLLQSSYTGEIWILPALPDTWKQGSVTGLRARGNITVDIFWKESKLNYAVIYGKAGNEGKAFYDDHMIKFKIGVDGKLRLDGEDLNEKLLYPAMPERIE